MTVADADPAAALSREQGPEREPRLRLVLRALHHDRHVYGFISVYTILSLCLAKLVGHSHLFAPLLYAQGWLTSLRTFMAIFLAYAAALSIRSKSPVSTLVQSIANPTYWAGMATMLCLSIFIGVFTSAKTMLPEVRPFYLDPALANLDHAVFGVDPWRLLMFMKPLLPVASFIYGQCWIALLFTATGAIISHERFGAIRTRFIWTFLICWVLLGNILALMGMSAGPAFYQFVTGDSRFHGLTAYLAGSQTAQTQADLWRAYVNRNIELGSGISAFPSMHLSMTTLLVLAARRIHLVFGWAAKAFLLFIFLCSIFLGWHYATDGIVSIISTAAIWSLVGMWLERQARQSPPPRMVAA